MAESRLSLQDSQSTRRSANDMKVGEDLTSASEKLDDVAKLSLVKEAQRRFPPMKKVTQLKNVDPTTKGYSHVFLSTLSST